MPHSDFRKVFDHHVGTAAQEVAGVPAAVDTDDM
jgi:hypothetical protein